MAAPTENLRAPGPRNRSARRVVGSRVSAQEIDRFLALIRDERLSMPTACARTGLRYEWVHGRKASDPRFAARLREALIPALGEVHDAVKTAATLPDERGRYDVRAQELFLTINDPDYRDKKKGLWSGNQTVNVTVAPISLSPEERVVVSELGKRRLGIGPDVVVEAQELLEAGPPAAPTPAEMLDAEGW